MIAARRQDTREAALRPENAQEELVNSLVQMRAEHLGIYHVDEEVEAVCTSSSTGSIIRSSP